MATRAPRKTGHSPPLPKEKGSHTTPASRCATPTGAVVVKLSPRPETFRGQRADLHKGQNMGITTAKAKPAREAGHSRGGGGQRSSPQPRSGAPDQAHHRQPPSPRHVSHGMNQGRRGRSCKGSRPRASGDFSRGDSHVCCVSSMLGTGKEG
jgi:hypothetical protein